jgi:hypothetical protein
LHSCFHQQTPILNITDISRSIYITEQFKESLQDFQARKSLKLTFILLTILMHFLPNIKEIFFADFFSELLHKIRAGDRKRV